MTSTALAPPGTSAPIGSAPNGSAPTGSVPTQRGARYPLESIRALAAISVLVFHAYQNNWDDGTYPWQGWPHAVMMSSDMAVDLFFVISGFLLWLPVTRALLAGRPQRRGRQLLARRSVRLLPLYVIVLLVAWALANPALPGNWRDLVAHLTMTHVHTETYIFWTVGPAWTLAVEFHAFVAVAALLPLITRLTPRLASRGQRLALAAGIPTVIASIGLAYLTYHQLVLDTPHDAWTVWFGPVAKMHLFATGMALAVLNAVGVRLGRTARRLLLAGSLALVLTGIWARTLLDPATAEWLHVAFALVAGAVLSTIVLSRDEQPRWLSWGPTVWLGTLSYSIYLVHEPILKALRSSGVLPPAGSLEGIAVTAAATLVLAVLVARLANRHIEMPLMRAYDSLQQVPDRYAEVGSEAARSR